MAVLISKIVRGAYRLDNQGSSTDTRTDSTHLRTINDNATTTTMQQPQEYFPGRGRDLETFHTYVGRADGDSSLTDQVDGDGKGILKTVTMSLAEDDEC
jgi:hypothetical protein